MKNIIRTKNIVFFISLLTSIGFPAGVVALILGATNEKTLLMVLGLILLVVCFFALPFVWLKFASLLPKARLVNAVTKKGVKDIDVLANIFRKTPQEITIILNDLIAKGYLDHSVLYEEEVKSVVTYKCPNCGAPLIVKENSRVCEYCSAVYTE